MTYVFAIAIAGMLLLQATGAIPASSVGGPMTIALAFFVGALAIALYEAWTRRRGILGWIVNIALAFVGVFVAAPVAGMVMALVLGPFMNGGGSLAANGGPLFSVALAGSMALTMLGAWGALWIVNRWRDA